MSTTAPAEIEIPRKFLPAFVVAANLDVMGHAEGLGNALSLDYTHEGRVQDDAKLATLTASIQMGAALLQAFDDKRGRVPRSLAQSYAADAISHVRCDLRDPVDSDHDPAPLADLATVHRDLVAWVIE